MITEIERQKTHSLLYSSIIDKFNIEDNYSNDSLLDDICEFCNKEDIQEKFLNNKDKIVYSELFNFISNKNRKILRNLAKKVPNVK